MQLNVKRSFIEIYQCNKRSKNARAFYNYSRESCHIKTHVTRLGTELNEVDRAMATARLVCKATKGNLFVL